MTGKKMRLMEVDEIVHRFKFSERHARRLRQAEDRRCYVEEYDRPAIRPNILRALRPILKRLQHISLELLILHEDAGDYDCPENWEDIVATFESINRAQHAAWDAAGYYHWRNPDGTPNSPDGFPTIYERARSRMPVHRAFEKQITEWAAKYGHKIDPGIYFGECEDEDDADPI